MIEREHEQGLSAELSLKDYVAVFSRQRWILVGAFLSVLLAAGIWTLVTPRKYESTASVILRTAASQQLFPSIGASQVSQFTREPAAELEYVSSSAFVNEAKAASPALATVRPRYDGNFRLDRSSQLEFVAVSTDPREAQAAASQWANLYVELRSAEVIEANATIIDGIETLLADLEREKAEILLPIKPLDDALLAETDSDTISRLTNQRLTLRQSLEDELLPITFQLRQLSQELSSLRIAAGLVSQPDISARVSVEAPVGKQVAPSATRNMALASALGLFIGAGAALTNENFRGVVNSASDLEAIAPSVQVLAQLPQFPRGTTSPLELAAEPGSQYAQGLERIASALLYRRVGLPGNRMKVLITSALPQAGKTTVASHLSLRLGSTQSPTILIDADMRRPDVHHLFGIDDAGPGLSELLRSGDPLAAHLKEMPQLPQLRVLSAGHATDEAAALLRQRFRSAIESLPTDYDLLIVDAPPVLAVTDAEVMVDAVDTAVVIVRAGVTTRGQLKQTLQRLMNAGATLSGFVLVGVKSSTGASYSDLYDYQAHDRPKTALRGGTRALPEASSTPAATVNNTVATQSLASSWLDAASGDLYQTSRTTGALSFALTAPSSFASTLDELLGALSETTQVHHRILISQSPEQTYEFRVDGTELQPALTVADTIDRLFTTIGELSIAKSRERLHIRSGVVGFPDGDILIYGSPPKGISPVAAALHGLDDARYGSDAMAGLDPKSQTVLTWPKPIWLDHAESNDWGDDVTTRFSPWTSGVAIGQHFRPRVIVKVRFKAGAEAKLRSLHPADAAVQLAARTEQFGRFKPRGLQAICKLTAAASCFELIHSSTADEVAQTLRALINDEAANQIRVEAVAYRAPSTEIGHGPSIEAVRVGRGLALYNYERSTGGTLGQEATELWLQIDGRTRLEDIIAAGGKGSAWADKLIERGLLVHPHSPRAHQSSRL